MNNLDPWLEEKINELSMEIEECRTIDCLLVKLTTLVHDVEEYTSSIPSRDRRGLSRGIFEEIIRHPKTINRLSILSCHVDIVKSMLWATPRFKKLREYEDILIRILENTECNSSRYLDISREPTYVIEREEYLRREPLYTRGKRRIKRVILVGIVVVLVTLAMLIYHLVYR